MSIHANMSGWEFNEFQCKILERVLNYMFMNKLVNYKSEDLFGWSYDIVILPCLVKSNINKKN